MEEEVVMSRWAGGTGVPWIWVLKDWLGWSFKKWEKVNSTAQSQGQESTAHICTRVSSSSELDLLVKVTPERLLQQAAEGRLEVLRLPTVCDLTAAGWLFLAVELGMRSISNIARELNFQKAILITVLKMD